MPGNVLAAAPTLVMPAVACSSFERSPEWACDADRYPDGDEQVVSVVNSARYSWNLSVLAGPAALIALRNFYRQCKGPLLSFYFYDPYFAGFAHDPAGLAVEGRFAARFASPWRQRAQIGRGEAELSIIQIA